MVDPIPVQRLRQLVRYDQETGALTWLPRPAEPRFTGRYADQPSLSHVSPTTGYRHGSLDGRDTSAHRAAWALHYGEWPHGQIDHINGDRADNRISNLRLADHVENGRNCKLYKNNKSGVVGVRWVQKARRWWASIRVRQRLIHLGYFTEKDAAIAARKAAEKAHDFQPGHGRKQEQEA